MPQFTIFTAPKPFTNPHIAVIQRNAIQSWLSLGHEVDVLLFGQEQGLPEVAGEFGVRHIPEVPCSETGAPIISAMFRIARQVSPSPYLIVVNADIILFPELLQAAQQVARQAQKFLLAGQRWDLDVTGPLDFSPGWVEQLKDRLRSQGQLHLPSGSDYFVFPRPCYQEVPDFTIGRSGWDNWMIAAAIKQNWLAVDVTPSAWVVHQNHDYSHLPGGMAHYHLEESNRNRELAGGKSNLYILLDIDKQLVDGEVVTARRSWARAIRKVELSLYPSQGNPHGLRRLLIQRLRRLRRAVNTGV